MVKYINKRDGISLIEVMVVVCILAILTVIFSANYMTQLKKGRDGRRKADMQRIKISFEDYYNDNGCYPTDVLVFENCHSKDLYVDGGFAPWLASIPCDPLENSYEIIVDESTCPSQFAIYTNMEYLNDPQVEANDCYTGCGIYNFAYSSDNINPSDLAGSLPGSDPTSTPAPTNTPIPTPTIDAGACGSGCYRWDVGGQTCNVTNGTCEAPNCYVGQCGQGCEVSVCPIP